MVFQIYDEEGSTEFFLSFFGADISTTGRS